MKSDFLNISVDELESLGGINTAREIAGQPNLWQKTFDLFSDNFTNIENFLRTIFQKTNLKIILSGAGTSAFIGEALAPVFTKHTGNFSIAVPTTDIVTHPEYYFNKMQPTLMISFARSGDSPESVQSVNLANKICNDIHHLVITCNPEGQLAKMVSGSEKDFLFLLPQEANDKSLAMTGSFTSMVLTGLLFAMFEKFENASQNVKQLIAYGNMILENYLSELMKIAELDFDRAVFLGSGFFGGAARESHLKLQELTNGKVICKFDSFLGFRHGPKAVINNKTLIGFIFSNNEYANKYERDLENSIESGENALYKLGISEHKISGVDLDTEIVLNEIDNKKIAEEFLLPVSVLPAQILGFYKSINLGLSPDNPSVNGLISRVVQGVKLYEYQG